MKGFGQEKICPQCHFAGMISFDELDEEQQMLVERLPATLRFRPEERRRHFFCPRCWHEEVPDPEEYC